MFKDIGINHVKKFLSHETKKILNDEIDEISKNYLINGVTRASTWINNNLCEISNPIVNIHGVNLLEIAFEVHNELIKATSYNYKLSAGLECRLQGFSFYSYPTAIEYSCHIPLSEDNYTSKQYIKILFNF